MIRIALSLVLAFAAVAGASAGRVSASLNDNWSFRFAHQVSGPGTRVDLPHTWNAGDALSGRPDYYRGTGIYDRKLRIEPSMQGKKLYLRFKGANQSAAVFVNSCYAGGHKGGYGAFTTDITGLVDPGRDNELTVKVSNALDLGIMPLVGDFNMYGGLYRDVDLIAVEPLHISLTDYASPGVYLTPLNVSRDRADVEAAVVVENSADAEAEGTVEVRVMDGDKVKTTAAAPFNLGAGASERLSLDLAVENPHLWNGRKDPFIYTAVVEVRDAVGRVTDSITQPLGLRFYGVDPDKGFTLNGEPLRLHGVCRHQDRAERGNALLPAHHEEDADIICEIGANAVRLAHYPQDSYFYDLMDRKGIIVWAEIPFIGPGGYHDRGFNDIPEFRDNGREQLKELIRQHYNHPSICFWGIFNELKTHGDNPTEYVASLNELAHSEDPARLTTSASFLDSDNAINGVTDLIAWNKYMGWYGGQPSDLGRWLDETHSRYPGYRIGISEYGAGASIYHQQDSVKPGLASGMWHPENYQTAYHIGNWKEIESRPFVWASFVWNLFDFGAAHRTEGDRTGINDKGLVTFDRKTRKDAFYFYKANWNHDEPFVYIAERRHDRRTSAKTDVMVFSNHHEVTLTLNGRKLGKMTPQGHGTFISRGVELAPGANRLEVTAGSGRHASTDAVTWTLQ